MYDFNKQKLLDEVRSKFLTEFNNTSTITTLTPGRINIIGEHTDYNKGLAMPISINKWICNAISKSDNHESTIYSMNFNDKLVTNDKSIKIHNEKIWKKITNRVIHILSEEFKINSGINIVVGGNIPIGCGLSSSSAFIISLINSILKVHSLSLNNKELAIYSQQIENKILGTAEGLLDQYGIIFSRKNYFMLLDFKNNNIEYFPAEINNSTWVIINSKITRELSESAYIERVKECKMGLQIINKKFNYSVSSLSEINKNMLSSLKNENQLLYKRACHVYYENQRVIELKKEIENKSYNKIGLILQDSHKSLKELYEVSCKEIDFIIQTAENIEGWYGGRIVGGGFGGCSIHLVNKKSVKKFINIITDSYFKQFDITPQILQTSFSNGIEFYGKT